MNYVDRQKTTFSKSRSNIYLSREELEKMVPIEKINEILKTNNFKQVEEGEKNENRNSIKQNTYNIVKIENKLNVFISTNGIEGTSVEGLHFNYRTNKPDLKEFEEEFLNSKNNQLIEKFDLGKEIKKSQKKKEEMEKYRDKLEENIQSKRMSKLSQIEDKIFFLEDRLKEYGIDNFYENGFIKKEKLDEQIKNLQENEYEKYKKLDKSIYLDLDETSSEIKNLHKEYNLTENIVADTDSYGYIGLFDDKTNDLLVDGIIYSEYEEGKFMTSFFSQNYSEKKKYDIDPELITQLITLEDLENEIKFEKNEIHDFIEEAICYSQIDSEKLKNFKNKLEVESELFTNHKKDNLYWEYMEKKGINLVDIDENISEKEKEFLKGFISKEETNYQNPKEKTDNLIKNIKERIPTNQKKDELLVQEIGNSEFIDIEKISKKINVSKKSIKRKVVRSKSKEDDLEL